MTSTSDNDRDFKRSLLSRPAMSYYGWNGFDGIRKLVQDIQKESADLANQVARSSGDAKKDIDVLRKACDSLLSNGEGMLSKGITLESKNEALQRELTCHDAVLYDRDHHKAKAQYSVLRSNIDLRLDYNARESQRNQSSAAKAAFHANMEDVSGGVVSVVDQAQKILGDAKVEDDKFGKDIHLLVEEMHCLRQQTYQMISHYDKLEGDYTNSQFWLDCKKSALHDRDPYNTWKELVSGHLEKMTQADIEAEERALGSEGANTPDGFPSPQDSMDHLP